jgi:hypothetical protein
VSTTEKLLDRNVAAPVYKTENTAVGIRQADRVAITSPTSGGRSVGIVSSRTQTMEFKVLNSSIQVQLQFVFTKIHYVLEAQLPSLRGRYITRKSIIKLSSIFPFSH